jgi:hypothetical protein
VLRFRGDVPPAVEIGEAVAAIVGHGAHAASSRVYLFTSFDTVAMMGIECGAAFNDRCAAPTRNQCWIPRAERRRALISCSALASPMSDDEGFPGVGRDHPNRRPLLALHFVCAWPALGTPLAARFVKLIRDESRRYSQRRERIDVIFDNVALNLLSRLKLTLCPRGRAADRFSSRVNLHIT